MNKQIKELGNTSKKMLLDIYFVVSYFFKSLISPILANLRRVKDKKGIYTALVNIKYLKRGNKVETPTGETGKIWKVYVSIKDDVPRSCSVMWDSSYKGEEISFFLPVEDMGTEFNPILRKIVEK